ncbi:RAMP superfamily CRISPR-associated protein [Desulfatirhabdium butyrativorans]|uniref:RAMP superfamily CRISPR-associated protein n=1 Tax=Desulfatirhabdium butyrativorans TaxID=340467 RepID=UPI000401D7CD|nr:RAMP superfamily CRISPR-associated protein [Desulfatirhabdium butyrativorans]
MNLFHLKARLLAPVLIQKNRQSNMAGGLPYIPGSTLRGAVAMSVLRKGVSPDSEGFQDIFIKRPVAFPDLVPAQPNGTGFVLPLTAISCKRHPGFRTEGHHGVGDGLAALAAAALDNQPKPQGFVCPICDQDTKPFSGFWNGQWETPSQTDIVMCYHRHTGIDRQTNTVAQSIFYVTQAMAENRKNAAGDLEDTWLTGTLWLDDAQQECLTKWLAQPIFIGADKTRGMGEVHVHVVPARESEIDIDHWNRMFQKKVGSNAKQPPPDGIYFSIDMISHAILMDAFLRPTVEWTPDFPEIEPVTRIIRRQAVHGWHAAWNMPKSQDIAVSRGSVYLFRYTGADPAGLTTYLKALARSGVGLRKPEGFGRIDICHPLHIKEWI